MGGVTARHSGKVAVMGYVAFVLHAAAVITSTAMRREEIVGRLRELVFVCRHMAGLSVRVHCFYFHRDVTLEGGAWRGRVCVSVCACACSGGGGERERAGVGVCGLASEPGPGEHEVNWMVQQLICVFVRGAASPGARVCACV